MASSDLPDRMRIEHVDADGTRLSQMLLPLNIVTKNYYLWVDAVDEGTGETLTIRADRIGAVEFLS